jgi:O-acetyl-ADP-ribose deacetylase (regulator of RNase III)
MTTFTLFDTNRALCKKWRRDFDQFIGEGDFVRVEHMSFNELHHHDCIVTPSNSFGIMDRGIGLDLRNYFDRAEKAEHLPSIQDSIQSDIRSKYGLVQPIGTCLIVETNDSEYPYLAHVPTALTSMHYTTRYSVFFATLAMLVELQANKHIETVACCGLGSLVRASKQTSQEMFLAFKYFYTNWNVDEPNFISTHSAKKFLDELGALL